jgi:hypothetical protein
MTDPTTHEIKQTLRWTRRLTIFIAGLALGVGPLLLILPDSTDTLFSWTIKPALTAAFLGGGYLTALAIELAAARERVWARAWVVYPAMLIFTSLTLLATFLHLDKFHFSGPGFLATLTAWAWLIVYIIAPPLMVVLLYLQLRAPGADPKPDRPVPAWFLLLLVIEAGVMLVIGAMLFIVPGLANFIWPWTLTPLTSQAVGAWQLGLGFAVAHSVLVRQWERIRITMIGNIVAGGVQLVTVLRFWQTLSWNGLSAWFYTLFLIGMFLVGLYGWRVSRRVAAH